MVFYLPDEAALAGSRIHKKLSGSDQNPWCHPAVVVGKKIATDGEKCVKIRLCTTFGGMHVEVRKPVQQQKLFMLADNTEDKTPHGSTSLAKMTASARFSKRTYVNLSIASEYTVEYKHLISYNGKPPMQFDAISLAKIRSGCPDRAELVENITPPMAQRLKLFKNTI